jgi:hypothetical protein
MEVSLTSPALPLPTGFSIVETLDEDPVATAYVLGDGAGDEAVLTVARVAVPADDRAAYRRWAGALLGAAGGTTTIARILTADVTPDGRPFLVTETGAVLGDHLEETGPLPVAAGVAYGGALADALACAHSAGIPHGAVQPATVLVADGRAALAGFGGVAPGLAVATVADAYTPPELLPDAFVGRAVATPAGDVYQLGVTIYVSLGGVLPWQTTPLDLAARGTPLARTPAVRGELLALLRAMTSTDAAARPNAGQVRDWLANFDPDGLREDRAIPPELLAGRGVRKVGRRTATLASLAGGAAGVTVGTLAMQTGSAAVPAATTAAATPAAVSAVAPAIVPAVAAPAAVTTSAVTTGVVSAGVSVTKVVVITAVSAVVGVGGVVGVTEVLGDGPCDAVVAERPLETVLAGSVGYLENSAFSFRLRYGEEVNAEGAVDPVARTASFALTPPGTYVGEVRMNGDELSMSGPIAGTADGEWTRRSASSDPVAQTVVAVPKTVGTMLAGAKGVERDGCDFTGMVSTEERPLSFQATIEDGTGHLRRLTVAPSEAMTAIDLEVTRTGPGTSPSATTTTIAEPPPRSDLTGRWVNGPRALIINNSVAGITVNDEPICSGDVFSAGTSVDITFDCVSGYFPGNVVPAHVELTGQDQVTVTGFGGESLDGVYLAGT